MTDLATDVARVLESAYRLVPRYVPYQDRGDVVQSAMLRMVPLMQHRDVDELLRLLPRLIRWVAASVMGVTVVATPLPDDVAAPTPTDESSDAAPIDGSVYLVHLKGVPFRVVDAVLQGASGAAQISDRAGIRKRDVRAALSKAVQALR